MKKRDSNVITFEKLFIILTFIVDLTALIVELCA